MIISISGVPGSGKTSVGKILAEKLGMKFYSVGGIRGKMALDRGITIDQLNVIGETDPSTDKEADEYQRELGKKEDNLVIEGRVSWYFIPHSYKIFLSCDPQESARRIFEARTHGDKSRSDEPMYTGPEQVLKEITERSASDARRYAAHYGVIYDDPKNFDLIMDTTQMSGPEETAAKILEKLPKA